MFFLQRFERRGITRHEKAVQSAEIAVDVLARDDGLDQIDGGTEALDDLPRTLIAEASEQVGETIVGNRDVSSAARGLARGQIDRFEDRYAQSCFG